MFVTTYVVPFFYMLSLLFLLLCPLLCASALHVEMRGELGPSPAAKRDHMSGLENGRNLNYMVNIALGGQQIQVVIDTGRYLSRLVTLFSMKCPHISAFISSDLWVSSTIATANDTGVHSGLTYAIGKVSGKWARTYHSGKLSISSRSRRDQNRTVRVSRVYGSRSGIQ